MGRFPNEYPPDLLERIMQEGGGYVDLHVYRVATYGAENPDSYLSTFLNDKKRGVDRHRDLNNLSTYSTSCFTSKEAAVDLLGLYFRREPKAEVAEGETLPAFGPCRESASSPHVDWWLFADATPWKTFSRTEV